MIDYDRMKKLFSRLFLIVAIANLALCARAQPITVAPAQNSPANEWQTFQDSRYIFQFEYPAKWSTEDRQGAVDPLILRNEQESEIIAISGINFTIIGISYCGAYPQDSRCEVLKAEGGDVFIDWNVDREAYAMLSAPNGTSGVGVTLHKINPETKTAFLRILSTFKLLK